MSSVIDGNQKIVERASVVAHQLDLNARARDYRAFMDTIAAKEGIPPLAVVVNGYGYPIWDSVGTSIERAHQFAADLLAADGHGWEILEDEGYEVVRVAALPMANPAKGWFSQPHVDLIDLLERAAQTINELSPDDESGHASKRLCAEIYEVLLRTSFVLSGFKDLHSGEDSE